FFSSVSATHTCNLLSLHDALPICLGAVTVVPVQHQAGSVVPLATDCRSLGSVLGYEIREEIRESRDLWSWGVRGCGRTLLFSSLLCIAIRIAIRNAIRIAIRIVSLAPADGCTLLTCTLASDGLLCRVLVLEVVVEAPSAVAHPVEETRIDTRAKVALPIALRSAMRCACQSHNSSHRERSVGEVL